MKLEIIKIKNFGTFDDENAILIKGKFATIIGDNGIGKSTILFAIKLLLDRKIRTKGIPLEWIPNDKISSSIEYVFDSSDFERISIVLPIEEDSKITIKLNFELDEDLNMFFPIIYIGKIENLRYSYSQKLPFDDFIEIIHIESNIENKTSEWIENHYKDSNVLENINKEIKEIINGENFPISLEPNIYTTKIGRALNIFSKNRNNKILTHGGGFEKILSILSNIKQSKKEKIKIIIIDELENNFFHTYQRKIINHLEKMFTNNISQIITTTHSPNVVNISPNSSITKLRYKMKASHFQFHVSNKFDYYQKDLSTAIFYENILLVEGHSEKMFYEYLFKYNKELNKVLDTSKIYILNNQGIYFEETMLFLKEMTNKVIILTDNDVWKNNYKIKKCFGLERIWKLSCKLENIVDNKINFNLENIESDKNILNKILNKGIKNNIFTQKKIGATFEDALLNEELINEKEMEQLKISKLKKLSEFIENISDKINKDVIDKSEYLFKWIIESFDD